MDKNLNLIEGNISSTIIRLALPIMGTSFIQMAYNLTDILWLGQLSTKALAAAGTVGFFMWFGAGLMLISRIGVGVGVSQSYGRDEIQEAKKYISHGLQLDILIAVLYSLFLYMFRYRIIDFFNIDDIQVYHMAVDYMKIISLGIVFNFINPIFSTILNSIGDSVTPFKVNTIGLIFNMILDPILIFGIGPVKGMGIKGAAIATVLAQIIVSFIFIVIGEREEKLLYSHRDIFKKIDKSYIWRIAKLGFPAFLQTAAHSGIGMILTRIVAEFGATPIAVQTVGTQIESISWMTSEGFSAAISAFMGQNYGAEKYDRIKEGYRKGMKMVGSIGIFASLFLIFGAKPLFKIFTPDDAYAIEEGIKYLRILGLCQFFMGIEIGTAGAFNGLGKTLMPAIVGVSFNVLRIPMAIVLSNPNLLGLTGVWWSISISSILKGIVLPTWFINTLRKIE